MESLEGKLYVITGASGALGGEIVGQLLERDADVIAITGQNNLPESLSFGGKRCRQVSVDFSRSECHLWMDQLNQLVSESTSQLTGVVHAAGYSRDAILPKTGDDHWDRTFDINFKSAVNLVEALLPHFRKNGCGGHVIFIGSYAGLHGSHGQSAYSAAKAALIGLSASCAELYGPDNLQFNVVLPGFMLTPMTHHLPEKILESYKMKHKLSSFNTPESAACSIVHLLHTPYISGQTINLDSR